MHHKKTAENTQYTQTLKENKIYTLFQRQSQGKRNITLHHIKMLLLLPV